MFEPPPAVKLLAENPPAVVMAATLLAFMVV